MVVAEEGRRLRLIACCLCDRSEPFTCPVKFRRTYMGMHLERAHGFAAVGGKFRRQVSDERPLVARWRAEIGGKMTDVLVELDVNMHGAARSPSTGQGHGDAGVAGWASGALQEHHRNRQPKAPVIHD